MTHANKKIELEPDAGDWFSREPVLITADQRRRATEEWTALDAKGNLPETFKENER